MKSKLSLLLPIEWITLFYTLLTTILILIFDKRMPSANQLLLQRFEVALVVFLFVYLDRKFKLKLTRVLRTLFPLTLLAFWYPDTFDFCSLFNNLDHVFAHIDYAIFGCQPSIVFEQIFPKSIFSEVFHLGYFSYYPMIAATCILPFILPRKGVESRIVNFESVSFVVMAGFYLYYIIYLFLPVAGPQFYFPVIGYDQAAHGTYQAIGHYFANHSVLLKPLSEGGFFQSLVETMQAAGEKPTAAFPSSHVGMSTILMLLLYKQRKGAALIFLPFYIILCASTVYIKAHYFIDVLGGWATAILFYYIAINLYQVMCPHKHQIDIHREDL